MKKKLYIAITFSVMLMMGISSCVNRPSKTIENDSKKTNAEMQKNTDSVVISKVKNVQQKEPLSKERLKENVEYFFRQKFGRFAKVKKWTKCDIATTGNSFLSGVVSAPVRGDKSNYSFDAIVNSDAEVRSMQLSHVGKNDCYYNWVEGQRLDDNIYSSKASIGNIRLTAIGLRSEGIRYVTSRKMSKEQIMKFITEKTDMKLMNYYFQINEYSQEYAAYNGDENEGTLFMYDRNMIFSITIHSDRSITYR